MPYVTSHTPGQQKHNKTCSKTCSVFNEKFDKNLVLKLEVH